MADLGKLTQLLTGNDPLLSLNDPPPPTPHVQPAANVERPVPSSATTSNTFPPTPITTTSTSTTSNLTNNTDQKLSKPLISEISMGLEVVNPFPDTVCTHTSSFEMVEGVRHEQVVVLVSLPPSSPLPPPLHMKYFLLHTPSFIHIP